MIKGHEQSWQNVHGMNIWDCFSVSHNSFHLRSLDVQTITVLSAILVSSKLDYVCSSPKLLIVYIYVNI
jgi:hypothetical protein